MIDENLLISNVDSPPRDGLRADSVLLGPLVGLEGLGAHWPESRAEHVLVPERLDVDIERGLEEVFGLLVDFEEILRLVD